MEHTRVQSAGSNDYNESVEIAAYDFGLKRRSFVQMLGAGLLIAVGAPAVAQRGGGGGRGGAGKISARVFLGKDGSITVFTGKVEGGQGARAELSQAAAEELRVPVEGLRLVMADTAQVPDDGITAGSRSTPSTVPAVRQGAAAVREVLTEYAAAKWGVDRDTVRVIEGRATHEASGRSLGYGDLASDPDAARRLEDRVPGNVALTPVKEWKSLGASAPRPNRRDIVTGAHVYPSDVRRPGMLYGKVLRPPSYGARLVGIDLGPATAMAGVMAVRDGAFVGVAAPTTHQARAALAAIAETAQWETTPHVSSREVFDHLRKTAQGGIPANPHADLVSKAAHSLKRVYRVAYVQHAPLEPRAAAAEWENEKLTVWTGTQNPFGCRGELARAFHLSEEQVRVIVPDFGGGFGGKHTGEVGVEAARLARAAKKPVSLQWTREEEFTWAYFRPAALIEAEAGVDAGGRLTSWHFVNVNSGQAALDTPYRAGEKHCRHVPAETPLRQGSYRALAATANTFARECFMDELAAAAGKDPLTFRLANLENERLRAVLETAAERFRYRERAGGKDPKVGIGLACGTEKGSFVAVCVQVAIGPNRGITLEEACEVFECGAVLNPANLRSQIEGQIMMALGPALREEIQFENGVVSNAAFRKYPVPRLADVPRLDIHVLDRKDLPSAGGGETPLIALAPAIASAVFDATGVRIREMPIRLPRN